MPSLILPDRFKKSLWAVERIDGRGFLTYEDHSQKEPGGSPIPMLLLWTEVEAAERYCAEQIKGSGRPWPVERHEVVGFLTRIREQTAGRVNFVLLNKPPEDAADKESFRTGIAEIPVLVHYLRTGGRLGGDGAA